MDEEIFMTIEEKKFSEEILRQIHQAETQMMLDRLGSGRSDYAQRLHPKDCLHQYSVEHVSEEVGRKTICIHCKLVQPEVLE